MNLVNKLGIGIMAAGLGGGIFSVGMGYHHAACAEEYSMIVRETESELSQTADKVNYEFLKNKKAFYERLEQRDKAASEGYTYGLIGSGSLMLLGLMLTYPYYSRKKEDKETKQKNKDNQKFNEKMETAFKRIEDECCCNDFQEEETGKK